MSQDEPGIYRITCMANGRCYIGSSRTKISHRWKTHRYALKTGRHANKKLQSHWDKYGPQSFTCEVMENCKPDACLDREQAIIDAIQPQLNLEMVVRHGETRVRHQSLSLRNHAMRHSICMILHNIHLLKDFCYTINPVRMFFGLPKPQRLSDEAKKNMRGPRGAYRSRGTPKPMAWRIKMSDIRKAYVADQRALGLWPPAFYQPSSTNHG